jgi:hypothetical protein
MQKARSQINLNVYYFDVGHHNTPEGPLSTLFLQSAVPAIGEGAAAQLQNRSLPK